MSEIKEADFHIDTKPVSISLECPYCECEMEIPWEDVDVPNYWGDEWGYVLCPECKETIELGYYEYD